MEPQLVGTRYRVYHLGNGGCLNLKIVVGVGVLVNNNDTILKIGAGVSIDVEVVIDVEQGRSPIAVYPLVTALSIKVKFLVSIQRQRT